MKKLLLILLITVASCSDEIACDPELVVYPNPVENELIIESNTDYEVFVFDESGKYLFSGTDFSTLPYGIYFVRVETDCGNESFKIIKN